MDSKKSLKTDGHDHDKDQIIKNYQSVFTLTGGNAAVFEAIRNSNNEITDFRMLLPQNSSTNAGHHGDGRSDGQDGDGKSDGHIVSKLGLLPGSNLFNSLAGVLESGEAFEEIFPERQDGHEQWFHLRIIPFQNGFFISRSEITNKKKVENTPSQQLKMQELETIRQEFQAELSQKNREIQNLQAEIKTFNTIASKEYHDTLRNLYTCMEFIISNDARNLSNPGKANIRRAQVAIQKMKLLTEDIVSYLDIHADNGNEAVDMNEVYAAVLHDLTNKLTESNGVISKSDLPVIRGYRHLLIMLFNNLIDNAIKFRKDESAPQIKVKHHTIPGKELEIPGSAPDILYDVITVMDNGTGFPTDESEKIFDLFYRQTGNGRHKGSGIGLAISKKIMDIHHGFIRAECQPDCTIFHCYFPRELK